MTKKKKGGAPHPSTSASHSSSKAGAGRGGAESAAAGGPALVAAAAPSVEHAAAAAAVASPPSDPAGSDASSCYSLLSSLESVVPNEVLLHIFEFCGAPAMGLVACVSHRWCGVAQGDILWRRLCKRAFSTFHSNPRSSARAAEAVVALRTASFAAVTAAAMADAYASRIMTPLSAFRSAAAAVRMLPPVASAGAGAAPTAASAAAAPAAASEQLRPSIDELGRLAKIVLDEDGRKRSEVGVARAAAPAAAAAASAPLLSHVSRGGPPAAVLAAAQRAWAVVFPPMCSDAVPAPVRAAAAADAESAAAAAAPVSLSLERMAALEAESREARALREAFRRSMHEREHMIEEWKARLLLLEGCFRRAYREIPLVYVHGVYALKIAFVQTAIRDLFHPDPGVLYCIYYRTFRFFEDGRCLYVTAAGPLDVSVREIKKEKKALPGRYRLEGSILHASVEDAKSSTKWSFRIRNAEYGSGVCTRLETLSMVMCERGASDGTHIAAVEGQDFVFFKVEGEWAKPQGPSMAPIGSGGGGGSSGAAKAAAAASGSGSGGGGGGGGSGSGGGKQRSAK